MQPSDHSTANSPQHDAPTGESVESGPSPSTDSPLAASLWNGWRERLGPRWEQTWRNLRVWFPGLANPDFRDREVIYGARESRKVSEWQVALPERCWECDSTDGLAHREVRGHVRSFEYALHIFGGGLGSALCLALFAMWIRSWFTLCLALVAVAVTVGLLLLKSWQESIRVAIWNCLDHETSEPELEMVVDDAELHLYLPNRRIAEHARDLLKKSRRGRAAYDTDAGPGPPAQRRPTSVDDQLSALPTSTDVPGSDVPGTGIPGSNVPGSGRYTSPHGSGGPSVPDLPPISIDDGPLLAEETGADTKQADTKQADTKQADTKQADTKQADNEQADEHEPISKPSSDATGADS